MCRGNSFDASLRTFLQYSNEDPHQINIHIEIRISHINMHGIVLGESHFWTYFSYEIMTVPETYMWLMTVVERSLYNNYSANFDTSVMECCELDRR